MRFQFQPGMRLVLKKSHPCGSAVWIILRTGADIKLQCEGCGHFTSLTRRKLEAAVVTVLGDKD